MASLGTKITSPINEVGILLKKIFNAAKQISSLINEGNRTNQMNLQFVVNDFLKQESFIFSISIECSSFSITTVNLLLLFRKYKYVTRSREGKLITKEHIAMHTYLNVKL